MGCRHKLPPTEGHRRQCAHAITGTSAVHGKRQGLKAAASGNEPHAYTLHSSGGVCIMCSHASARPGAPLNAAGWQAGLLGLLGCCIQRCIGSAVVGLPGGAQQGCH